MPGLRLDPVPGGATGRINSGPPPVETVCHRQVRFACRATPPGLRAKKRVSQFGLPVPVEPQPFRGESISFLSPAQAARALTFCYAAESRQRTQPRGLSPPWLSPAGTAQTWRRKTQSSCAERHRPRASATTTAIEATELYVSSAATGTAGRRPLRIPMPTTCTSPPLGSIRRTTITVRSVFRCVASRNRERGPLGTPTEPAGKKAGQPVWPPTPRRGPTLSGRINLFPLPRSSRGGSYFL